MFSPERFFYPIYKTAMNAKLVSMFSKQYNTLMGIQSVEGLRQELYQILVKADLQTTVRRKIILDINKFEQLVHLQRYVTNSMLKYQGLGVL
jgi:hypothetical protein